MTAPWQQLGLRLEVDTPAGGLYDNPGGWVDVLGRSNTVKITRSSLGVGTLSALILDTHLDPTRYEQGSEFLVPGTPIRATIDDPRGGGGRVPIYTGTVKRAQVTWDLKRHPDTLESPDRKASRITINAVDRLSAMANTAEARSVATVDELRWLLADHPGVPFVINGSSDTRASGTVRTENTAASLLDQVALARDTDQGRAWVGADGVLYADDGTAEHGQYAQQAITDPTLTDPAAWPAQPGVSTVYGISYDGKACGSIEGTDPQLVSVQLEAPDSYLADAGFSVQPATDGLAVQPYVTAYDDAGAVLWSRFDPDNEAAWIPIYAGEWQSLSTDAGWLRDDQAVARYTVTLAVRGTGRVYVTDAVAWWEFYALRAGDVSQLDTQFDSDAVVNQVNVRIRAGFGDDAEEVTLGPYSDEASVAKWGPHASTVTVIWPKGMDAWRYPTLEVEPFAQAWAEEYLANTDVDMQLKGAVVPIRTDTARHALIGLEQGVSVRDVGPSAELGVGTVDKITHTITPERWHMQLGLRAVQGNPPATQSAPLAKAATVATTSELYQYGGATVTVSGTTQVDLFSAPLTSSSRDDRWIITVVLDIQAAAGQFLGKLRIDNDYIEPRIVTDDTHRGMQPQQWLVTDLAPGDHTLTVTGETDRSSGEAWYRPSQTTMAIVRAP